MFTAEIIFISLTLLILVGITFYLKVPKASIPLIVIYLIFIIRNQLFDQPNELSMDYQDLTISKNKVVKENENNIELLWGVGGNDKSNSSSWILQKWKEEN